jgi:hypothetical protein
MVVADYVSPFPKNLLGFGQTLMEIMAGRIHYHNFLNWQDHGGIDGFIKHMGLRTIKMIPWNDGIGKIVTLSADV